VYTRPSGPRTIGEVLDDGLKLWREAFAKTWLLAMLGRMVVAVPSIFLVNRTIDTARLTSAQKFSMMMGQSAEHLWIFYLLLLMSYIFYTAILWRVAAVAENREVSMSESLKKGVTLLPRLLLFYIFLIIAMAILGIVVAILAGVLSVAAKSSLIVGVVIGCIVAVIAIYAVVRVFLGYVALVVDDKSAFQSLQLSWNLTRGNWWRTTAIFTVVVIIALVFSVAMYVIGGVFVATWGMLSMVTVVAVQILSVLVYALLGSLYPAVLYAAYQDLKLRREGSDLEGRVNALATP
jgi:hypothetical protein